ADYGRPPTTSRNPVRADPRRSSVDVAPPYEALAAPTTPPVDNYGDNLGETPTRLCTRCAMCCGKLKFFAAKTRLDRLFNFPQAVCKKFSASCDGRQIGRAHV